MKSKSIRIDGYNVYKDLVLSVIQGYELHRDGYKMIDYDDTTILFRNDSIGMEIELRFGWGKNED